MSGGTQRKLAAIVAADVVGYSRLVGVDEEGTLESLRGHRRALIDPAIETHKGRIANIAGDSLLLEFSSVVDAVRCAVVIQDGLAERNAGVTLDRRILMRIGINVGDVVAEGNDLLGDGVNIAARLEALAEPGGIALSDDAYRQIRDRLDLKWVDGGEQTLKNITRQVQVWRWLPKDQQSVLREQVENELLPPPTKPSIAVMSFDNMSGDPEQEYFSDGITEDIITELSRYRDFNVLARNSTLIFKGRAVDPTQVARDLNARFIVEGSVRRAGRRIRVSAQLIEGSTGNHIWAERYDRELEDIFEVQDEITRTITSTLGGRISEENLTRSLREKPSEVDAYDLCLQAFAFFERMSKEDNSKARRLAADAIQLAPEFALAQAIVSFTHTFEIMQMWGTDVKGSVKLAHEYAITAVSLNNMEERAHAALGFAELFLAHHDRAVESFHKAIRVNPNFADAHARLAIAYSYAGRAGEALATTDLAMRMNPHYPSWYLMVHGRSQYLLGDFEGAERSLRDILNSIQDYPAPRAYLAATLVAIGRRDEAKVEVEHLIDRTPLYRLCNLSNSQPFKDGETLDMFLDRLRQAGLPE